MTASKKIVVIFGTRPEAIKMAPLVQALQDEPGIDCKVVVTAQHREMLDQVLDLFQITPDYDLNIMQTVQTLYDITTRALTGLQDILLQEKPDMVLVHGDTTTTFAGALAAYYCRITVGHVEAGLRSHDKYSPYPEEMNRRLAGALSDLHFAPTAVARLNLINEGIQEKNIFVTGNTVIDALKKTVDKNYRFSEPLLESLDFENRRVLLVTTHRRENLGEPMRQTYLALRDLAKEFPDILIVFPVHKNPAVRLVAEEVLGNRENVWLIEPLEYQPFANLMERAFFILTDSGGLQEEAPALGKPVLVLRDKTERPEALEAGTVKMVGTKRDVIYRAAKRLLSDGEEYRKMAHAVNPYGDGQACRRIADALFYYWGWKRQRPQPFTPHNQ